MDSKTRNRLIAVLAIAAIGTIGACKKKPAGDAGSEASSKGIGPVSSVTLGAIDPAMVKSGQEVYEAKCAACHKMDEKVVGPALGGVTKRRTPEWIMNMILNPEEMTKQDPTAQALLAEHLTQMTFQNVTEKEARAILEYFRKTDEGK